MNSASSILLSQKMDSTSHSESDEEGFECDGCYQEFSVRRQHDCQICDGKLCRECLNGSDKLALTEWLTGISNICSECRLIGCSKCIVTCFDCAHDGVYNSFCKDCFSGVKTNNCPYHVEFLCNNHKRTECSGCASNKNYSQKYEY